MNKHIIPFLIGLSAIGCNRGAVPPKGAVQQDPSSVETANSTIGEDEATPKPDKSPFKKKYGKISFSATLITPTQRAKQISLNSTEFHQELKEQEKYTVYKVRVENSEGTNPLKESNSLDMTPDELRRYYSTIFPSQVTLVTEFDTISPVVFHLQAAPEDLNFIDVLITFNCPHETLKRQLILEDNAYMNGRIKLKA